MVFGEEGGGGGGGGVGGEKGDWEWILEEEILVQGGGVWGLRDEGSLLGRWVQARLRRCCECCTTVQLVFSSAKKPSAQNQHGADQVDV